jgi:hypothetical protein
VFVGGHAGSIREDIDFHGTEYMERVSACQGGKRQEKKGINEKILDIAAMLYILLLQ